MLGLGQAYCRKAKSNKQLGAKSLDRDHGDVHTCPHDSVMEWMDWCSWNTGCLGSGVDANSYKKMRNVRVQNQQSDEEGDWRVHSLISFMSPDSLYSPDPLTLLSARSQAPASPKLPATSDFCFWNWMHLQNCVGYVSLAELQLHRQILAPGSTVCSYMRQKSSI